MISARRPEAGCSNGRKPSGLRAHRVSCSSEQKTTPCHAGQEVPGRPERGHSCRLHRTDHVQADPVARPIATEPERRHAKLEDPGSRPLPLPRQAAPARVFDGWIDRDRPAAAPAAPVPDRSRFRPAEPTDVPDHGQPDRRHEVGCTAMHRERAERNRPRMLRLMTGLGLALLAFVATGTTEGSTPPSDRPEGFARFAHPINVDATPAPLLPGVPGQESLLGPLNHPFHPRNHQNEAKLRGIGRILTGPRHGPADRSRGPPGARSDLSSADRPCFKPADPGLSGILRALARGGPAGWTGPMTSEVHRRSTRSPRGSETSGGLRG